MEIFDKEIYNEATFYLKQLYSDDAVFKEGQYEAIESVVLGKRTLVVQKTGWGKSLVYFIATKILSKRTKGITLVVSPLLALMENQFIAANKLNLKTEMLNSNTASRREEILFNLDNNNIDLLLITPETLLSKVFYERLFRLNIMCFVIDEAHCISDWGHDFRLEYSKLNKVVSLLDSSVPILATTATANNRVINDLKNKLSNNLHLSKGSLKRNNIAIDIINFDQKVERYAWLLANLNKFEGTGIIYCLTQRDCDQLSNFLNSHNYNTLPYHSGIESSEDNLKKFEENKIKALVSTIKLGMGYDKDDVSFVIHYQLPQNLISYYQQIGRAGRNIPFSYAVLLNDKSDNSILNSFIDNAFCDEETILNIYNKIKEGFNSLTSLTAKLNYSLTTIKKALMFLEKDEFVSKDKTMYFINKEFEYDKEYYTNVTNARKNEMEEFQKYTQTKECYSEYLLKSLDDNNIERCGICSNCLNQNVLEFTDYKEYINPSLEFLNKVYLTIPPKKQYPNRKKLPYILNEGLTLCRYNDAGYGQLLNDYKENKEVILNKCVELLLPIVKSNNITHITNIYMQPFCIELATRLNIKYIDLIEISKVNKQREMENSVYQYQNACESFKIKEFSNIDSILLFDCFINSGWTISVVGGMLMEKGVTNVTPFTLASKAKW